MSIRHRSIPALAAGLFALGAQTALAPWGASDSAASAAEPMTVDFCFNDWPPYAEMDDTGAHGISVDILRAAADRAGLVAQFEELPWNRCLEMVRQGEVDAVMDAAMREEYLQGPESFSAYSNTIWVRDDNPMTALDFSALAGMRIGLVSGYEYPEALLMEIEANDIAVEYSLDDGANLRQLAFGRVDMIVADFVGTAMVARAREFPIHALQPAHSVDSLYPSFNPDRAELQGMIDDALRGMRTDGTTDRIYRAYVGSDFFEQADE